jgi:zinc transport system substrate-binding protein
VATARLAVVLAALVAIPGCGRDGDGADGRVGVVASFYPLAEAARRVGGDRARVDDLTPAGAEPHDLELTSGQVDAIERAEVVFYLGHGFQPSVEKAVRRSDGLLVDVLRGVETSDPHVWLDPVQMKGVVERVRDAYADVDKPRASRYQANADGFARELDALDAAFRQGLQDCDRRVFVTTHGAFGHLARRYGLTQRAIAGLSPESEPAPGRLSALADEVRAEGITTVFTETLVSPRVADSLAREAGVKTAVLNPLEGLTEDDLRHGRSYVSVMYDNLTALRSALGCR